LEAKELSIDKSEELFFPQSREISRKNFLCRLLFFCTLFSFSDFCKKKFFFNFYSKIKIFLGCKYYICLSNRNSRFNNFTCLLWYKLDCWSCFRKEIVKTISFYFSLKWNAQSC